MAKSKLAPARPASGRRATRSPGRAGARSGYRIEDRTGLLAGVALAAILALALALRLWGIDWGLPNALHDFSYHTDETVLLMRCVPAMGGMDVFAGNMLPGFYNYGSLHLYLVNIAVLFGSAYGLIGPVIAKSGAIDTANWAHAYLAGRLLSVLMGAGTVWVVYAIGARLWGRGAGLLAALLLAIMPLHAQHSHFLTVDVPSAFWSCLSLLWAVRGWQDEERPLRAFALAGLFCGLAAATKYNCALVFLSIGAAAFLPRHPQAPSPSQGRRGEEGNGTHDSPSAASGGRLPGPAGARAALWARAWVRVLLALAAAVIAFLITCPGAVLQQGLFMRDVLFEARHVGQQGEIYFRGTGPGWVYIAARNLDAGLGLPLLLLAIAGVVWGAVRHRREDLLLAAFALPYYLVVGAAQSRYARYEIPLLPVLALWSARLVADFGATKDPRRPAAIAVGSFVALFTLADCIALLLPMTRIDPRDRAAAWLAQQAPAPATIGFPSTPWFWSPPVDPYFTLPGVGQWRGAGDASVDPSRFVYNPAKAFDAVQLAAVRPKFVAIDEFEYYFWLRVNNPDALAYLATLRRGWRLAADFSDPHPLGGRRALDGLPVQDLPFDMLYTSPHILVYVRR